LLEAIAVEWGRRIAVLAESFDDADHAVSFCGRWSSVARCEERDEQGGRMERNSGLSHFRTSSSRRRRH
jgi:hypothetical protein